MLVKVFSPKNTYNFSYNAGNHPTFEEGELEVEDYE
jgi:hypothetical protein